MRVIEAAVIAEASGLSEPDFDVLVTLLEQPDRVMRSSDLAAAVGWDRSRLSHHALRLAGRGMVTREACPGDNRGIQFRMTETGVDAIRRATGPHFAAVKDILSNALTADQVRQLGEISDALLAYSARD
jgi:DNA-binding MarR family transcriptional regulator